MRKFVVILCQALATVAVAVTDPDSPRETVAGIEYPQRVVTNASGCLCLDFGRDAFGWLELEAPMAGLDYFIALGEHLLPGDIVDRRTPRFVRCNGVRWHSERSGFQRVPLAPDMRNSFPAKEGRMIAIPERFGVIAPFRAVEVYSCGFPISATNVRRRVVSYPADRHEAAFVAEDERLTRVWDLCRHTMFATSFAGQFVDGDRERIPYEADAYVSQLSWYSVSSDYAYPRKSIEYLYRHPTWPTEFKILSVLSAHADWMWTGDRRSLARNYDLLKTKLLTDYRREDGLVVSGGERSGASLTNRLGLADIVDWPPPERDDFDFRDVNAVVNAFHVRALEEMSEIAETLGKTEDASRFRVQAGRTRAAYGRAFFDRGRRIFVDGEGSCHASLHVNAVALAFGLVPTEAVDDVATWLESRGMACSVYFAQYLLEALFRSGRHRAAVRLIAADGDRSWLGMLKMGATITSEAWNHKVKMNMDWNHSWGTTALNVLTRFGVGVTPLEPGFAVIGIAPSAALGDFTAQVPTATGPVCVLVKCGNLHVRTPTCSRVTWKGRTYEVAAGEWSF